ncbi:hypothetical protein NST33_17860 [Paenibacillus sp. FSL L8-0435]|uniref:hypothetical protein n=1 Tax=Paenibacillus sp. FSL L8-0435 TaxID=2954618 RepID=UPI0030D7C405
MPRARVYKLFHTYDKEDLKIYFKTTMEDEFLIKLIKIWQLKLANYAQEYDWDSEDMMQLLETFGCARVTEDSGFKSYYEANTYLIWEYANTWYSEEECNDPQFNNPEADKILLRVLEENREWHKEYWEKWEQIEKERRQKGEAI